MLRRPSSRLYAAALHAALLALASPADGFTLVVKAGDTLASIAEANYGSIQRESLLVVANGLDAQGGSPITPGMRLEVPALGQRRVVAGDTWAKLATELLGASYRADVLSVANGSSPWLTPAEGEQIIVPYNLTVIAGQSDTTITLAYRFLGDMNKAWMLDHYNGLKGRKILRGDVLLIPLTDLALTPSGAEAARLAAGAACSEGSAEQRTLQRKADAELPSLGADLRAARYVEVLVRGTRLLANPGLLSKPQLATLHRALLEAFVALDAPGQAALACKAWRQQAPKQPLDPTWVSPKVLSACAGLE